MHKNVGAGKLKRFLVQCTWSILPCFVTLHGRKQERYAVGWILVYITSSALNFQQLIDFLHPYVRKSRTAGTTTGKVP